jgi:uncharacterized protein YjbI with pentapeptide repeats
MANPEHLAKLKEGVEAWNLWRNETLKDNHRTNADLREADLSGAHLSGMLLTHVNLHGANLRKVNLNSAVLMGADLRQADLTDADLGNAELLGAHLSSAKLRGANLCGARLLGADLRNADLREANLTNASLMNASLFQANLHEAILKEAHLAGANLLLADLSCADLRDADLHSACLQSTNLSDSDLREANLSLANLVRTNFERANLSGCAVYGVSVWDVSLDGAIQSNLVANPAYRSTIQVDNLEVAQFIYLLLNNERIRHVIDSITSKVVLILGRFTPERKAVLDAIRVELRKRDYVPVLFDFEKPESKDLTGTVTTLANMARFVIADLTDPSSVPLELATIVPVTIVPVQTILLNGQREFAMFEDLKRRYHWVLEPYRYESENSLLQHLEDEVIGPAEAKAKDLLRR